MAKSFNTTGAASKKFASNYLKEGLVNDGDIANINARDLMIAAQNPRYGDNVVGYNGKNPFDHAASTIGEWVEDFTPVDTGVLASTIRGKVKGVGDRIEFMALAGAQGAVRDNYQTTFMRNWKPATRANARSVGKKATINQKINFTKDKFYLGGNIDSQFGWSNSYVRRGNTDSRGKLYVYETVGGSKDGVHAKTWSKQTKNSSSKVDRAWARVGTYAKIQESKVHYLESGLKKAVPTIKEQYRVAYEMAVQRLVDINRKAGSF